MPSPNLGIDDVTTQTEKKTEKVNEIRDNLDDATQSPDTVAVAGDTTLTAEQFNRSFHQKLIGLTALAAGFTLYVPANARFFAVTNNSGFTATVRVTGDVGASVAITDGSGPIALICDGTDVVFITDTGAS